MTIRSKVLYAGVMDMSEDEVILAVVPAGHTWLIKDAVAYGLGFPSCRLGLYIVDVDAFKGYLIQESFDYPSLARFSGVLVAEAGMRLAATAFPTGCYVWLSGSDLLEPS